jgi:hypothetical protein
VGETLGPTVGAVVGGVEGFVVGGTVGAVVGPCPVGQWRHLSGLEGSGGMSGTGVATLAL